MSVDELARVRLILGRMLEADFPDADIYRSQLDAASLQRHTTGCQIVVDRRCGAPAAFDPARPSDKLAVEAFGHGSLWILLHAHEGYLDDLELLDAAHFPHPDELNIRID